MLKKESQRSIVNVNDLLPETHRYKALLSLIDLDIFNKELDSVGYAKTNRGYGIRRLFKCLLLQHLEDISDRDLESYLRENNAAKWFCGFELLEKTPDHTVFNRVRSKIGTSTLSKIFRIFKGKLKEKGFISEMFTFVDATKMISKANIWRIKEDALKKSMRNLIMKYYLKLQEIKMLV